MNLTCQVGGASGFAALNSNALTSTEFSVLTYVNSIKTDATFEFSVLT